MLIVVAIIAVLVSIVTPVLTKNLEKSREATDEANIRVAISTITNAYLSGEESSDTITRAVLLTQKQDNWSDSVAKIGGVSVPSTLTLTTGTNAKTYAVVTLYTKDAGTTTGTYTISSTDHKAGDILIEYAASTTATVIN